MLELGKQAEAGRKGMYSMEKKARYPLQLRTDIGDHILKRRKPLEMLVEYVRDGSTIKGVLLESMTSVMISFSGLQSPSCNVMNGEDADSVELGLQARYFTEKRLLHRVVNVQVEGVDTRNNVFGSVVPNYSTLMLQQGLARCVDWSMGYNKTRDTIRQLRQAEVDAKAKRVGLWKEFVAPQARSSGSLTGVVVEVVSGDCVVVLVGGTRDQPWLGEEKKFFLSSVRAPRLGGRNKGDEAWAVEARDLHVAKSIGKQVKVTVEYTREVRREVWFVFGVCMSYTYPTYLYPHN